MLIDRLSKMIQLLFWIDVPFKKFVDLSALPENEIIESSKKNFFFNIIVNKTLGN